MSFQYEDSLLEFDLDFLHQTSNTATATATTPELIRIAKCRKAIREAKQKIIATDGLVRKYYDKKEELEHLEKVLYSSKEECKKVCIDFRNITDKCTQLENEAQCLRNTNQELNEKCSETENLVSAIQSHANQLQTLVIENETVIEGLKVENQLEKATIKDYEKKITLKQKENKTLMKHMCLIKEIVFGKRILNKNDKAILEKYDRSYESDDNDSLFGSMFSDDETDMGSHFKYPLISKPIANKVDILSLRKASKEDLIVMKDYNDLDSDFSNEHASADTGRGSSLAFSDGEKCLHSPDYFMDRSPINRELTHKNIRDRVDVATSPIPSCQLVHKATSPIPAKQAAHIATSPIASYKAKDIILIAEPTYKTKGVIKHVASQCDQNEVELQLIEAGNKIVSEDTSSIGVDKNQKNTIKHNKINKNKSKMSFTSAEYASTNLITCNDQIHTTSMARVSPVKHSICSEIINEKECLELNNSDTLNLKNNKDGEIEMILTKMRFNRDLITPIPSSPSRNSGCSIQNQSFLRKEAQKIYAENKMWQSYFAKLINEVDNIKESLKNKHLLSPQHPKNRHNSIVESDYSEDDPILIPENVILNVEHDINSFERLKSNTEIITEGKVQQPASSISNNFDINESINSLEFEEPLPPILNDVTILNESVDKYANHENTDEEECYEEDIFHFGNIDNNKQATKRHKQRKLTKLGRFRQKLIPKNKIKLISSPKRKLHLKHLKLSKAKVADSMAASALSNKIAYEKAVKVMSELKTHQKSKEITLNTRKPNDKQISKKASEMRIGIPKDKSLTTKKLKGIEGTTTECTFEMKNANDKVDTSENHTFKMQDFKDTVNTSCRDHMMEIQDAKVTENTSPSGVQLQIQEKQITERKRANQIIILENILITDFKNCTDKNKVLGQVNPFNISKHNDKLQSNLDKKLEALTSAPEIKVVQKTDPIELLLPNDDFNPKSSKEKEPFTTDAFDSPDITVLIEKEKDSENDNEELHNHHPIESNEEINSDINTVLQMQQNIVLRSSIELSPNSNSQTDLTDLKKENTVSKLQQKKVLRSSIELSPKSKCKAESIELNKEYTASKSQPKRVLRSSIESSTNSNSKADSIEVNKEYTASNVQHKNRVLRSSIETSLSSNSKTDSIEHKKEDTALKLQPNRLLRSSVELRDSKSKRDSIELDKDILIPVVKCDKPPMSPSPKKLIATRSIKKCVGNLSASIGELKEVKSSAAEINQLESSPQKDISLDENKNMTCIVQGTRKRQKRTSLEKPDVECKRMLRSSTLRQTSIQENTKETSSKADDILLCADRVIKSDAAYSTKEKSVNVTKQILQKVQQNAVSYSDIDLFNDNTESNQHIDEIVSKTSCLNPKESILCVMLEKYGRQSIKNFSKKVPDSIVNIICKTIENEMSDIIQSTPRDSKQTMNKFVETVKKWDCKQFMAGLMQYLKDPQRKVELFSKVCTSPAPPMTKSEQILLFLVTQLRRAWPSIDIVDCVLCNMEYVLFKLNRTPEFETVESMSHLYAIICRYFKLKSRLRLFMLDAMYCIQFKSVPLIKQCMEVWMHVLPLAHMGIAKSPLVTCMVYLLHFYKCDDKFNRVQDIRHILNRKYYYEITEWNEPKIIEMFRNAIKDVKVIPVEMKLLRIALIVIAKRHGPKWCQKNIVKNLLIPIIENDSYSERVKVFSVSMLGPLLKPYPVDMRVHCEIVMNMLLDMLNHNLTPQMEEAIFSSLIFMSRHNYNRVVQALLTWKPKQISPYFENVIRDFVGEKPLRVWRAILLKITLA